MAGAGGSVCVCEYMLGQVHAGLGAVLQQVGRSVCAQMQGRDGVCCTAAWDPDVCACRSFWVSAEWHMSRMRLAWQWGGGRLH